MPVSVQKFLRPMRPVFATVEDLSEVIRSSEHRSADERDAVMDRRACICEAVIDPTRSTGSPT